MLAYMYGLVGEPGNDLANSPYTMLEKATIIRNISVFNKNLGKNVTAHTYGDGSVYDPISTTFKNAG
jgi:hypothetical protein